MFSRNSAIVLNYICRPRTCRGVATQAAKWDILASVCVERLPTVTPNLNKFQKEYQELLNTLEVEKSCKSDHEIRLEVERIYAEKLMKDGASIDSEDVSKITAQDFEDECNDEFAKFKLASLETEADKTNDIKSLERSLQSHLILLVEQTIGKDNLFLLPQGKHANGETLRQTAERVLNESCGDSISAQIYGNAPMGFYKYKYPKEQNGKTGAKVFFYYARYSSGQVKKDSQYKWLKRSELQTTLPQAYISSINEFLIEERA